ncbi:MAG: CRISPR-associated endonuclease Cas2 [Candidatus Hadarchaeota archaeon]
MLWWVIYDISENKVRSCASSKCKNYGLVRVQKSAFLGELSKNRAEMLSLELKDVIKEGDCIFLIPTCTNCFQDKIIHGSFDDAVAKKKDWYIIGGNDEV